VVTGVLGAWALLCVLTAPLAARTLRRVQGKGPLAGADVATAKLHLAFGSLLCVGVAVDALL
jgi:hypothetical protein